MAIAPSDMDSESGDSVASAGFSDPDLLDTDTDMDARLDPSSSSFKKSVLMQEQRVSLAHSGLQTEFIGVRHKASEPGAEVHQFRGIKYGRVPLRFRRSVMHESFPTRADATKNGPICPQIRNTRLESRLYGLPKDIIPEKEVLEENEFECLNLTISTPDASCRAQYGSLPVMFWIHGGGNVTGCATDWIWDAGTLVRRSVQIKKPVIIVAVNFRLGLFGFAASELLREDNAAAGEEGVGNYGLHDQRLALKWIRKYISGFGGDPYNVTLFGSSWGAADIHAHLLSSANQADVFAPPDHEGPLFHRAILQSGALVPSSSVVQDVGSAGHHLGRVMSSLHATTIEQLRTVPASKLVAAQGERVRPVDDGVFLRQDWRTLALPYSIAPETPESWRQDVIIGDVACESVLWAAPARLWAADAVARRAKAVVQSVRRADALMRAYEIADGSPTRETINLHLSAFEDDESSTSGSEETEDELAERVMELMNDVAFAWPVDIAARCAADSAFIFEEVSPPHVNADGYLTPRDGYLSTISEGSENVSSTTSRPSPSPSPQPQLKRYPNAPHVYRYVFDQASPYTGTPHHGVDLLYLFGNVPFPEDPDLTPEENEEVNWVHAKVREEMQARWLAFAWGEQPWNAALTPQQPAGVASMSDRGIFATPMLAPVSSFAGGLAASPSSTSPSSSRASSFSSAFGNANPFALTHLQSQHHYSQHHHLQHHINGGSHQHHGHSHHHGGGTIAGSGQLYGSAQPPPISISAADKVFVFGPDGETGARSATIFAGRRRVHAWRSALVPLGLATAQKVGLELGNGPPTPCSPRMVSS